jgi:hypothetical protein
VSFAATLRWVVASSATSYGYTLTVWATSAVVLHHRGIPTEANALAFVLGAIAAFAAVGFVANRGLPRLSPPHPRSFRLWQALHLLSVAVAIGGVAVITRLVHSWMAVAGERLHRYGRVPGGARGAAQRWRFRAALLTGLR